uniref:COMM domain-containing protein n=1 Tax=Acrobeloides nanus TaxID=290746 RepID=A0A914DSE1_9BILA
MRFRFIGGLDCPDWILTQIAEFSKIPPSDFKAWCLAMSDRLKMNKTEWDEESLSKLKGKIEIDARSIKAMIAALSFIIEKSAKNKCSPEDLEKEMLQLGMSAEHSRQLFHVYSSEMETLRKILIKKFIKSPSLSLMNKTTQEIDNAQVHKLQCRTSEGKVVKLAMTDQKLNVLKKELTKALESLEHI